MSANRLCALGWFLAGMFAWPHLVVAYDWLASEWERRHRPLWPPPGVLDQEQGEP